MTMKVRVNIKQTKVQTQFGGEIEYVEKKFPLHYGVGGTNETDRKPLQADVGVGEEIEQTDNRMKNMGIMFLFIGVAISLIAGAVFIRRRIEKNNASEEEQNQSKEATKNQK